MSEIVPSCCTMQLIEQHFHMFANVRPKHICIKYIQEDGSLVFKMMSHNALSLTICAQPRARGRIFKHSELSNSSRLETFT